MIEEFPRELRFIFGERIQLTSFTANTNHTALVPSEGKRIEVFRVIADAPDGTPASFTITDG